MKISVIIPVYNGEKYINKTIGLILNQAYKDIELILVNDGSTDGSREICEKYAKIDSRVILINKNNAGISAARNTGLGVATGEWISFIDQDDEISIDIYIKLTAQLDFSDDMVVAGKKMLLINEEDSVLQESIYDYEDDTVVDESRKLTHLFNINRDTRLLHLWNCLYKRKIIELFGIKFNTNLRYGHEDTLFNFEYVTKCIKIRYVKGVVYTYSRRMATSTSLKENKDYISDFKIYCDVVGNCLKKNDKRTESMLFTYLLRIGINMFKQYGKENDKIVLTDIYKKSIETAHSGKVARACTANKLLYLFYLTCSVLLAHNRLTLCVKIINLAPKK